VHERVPVRASQLLPSKSWLIIVSSSQSSALYLIALLAPLVLQWLINLLAVLNLWDAHNSALGRMTQNLPKIPIYPDQHV
jgi:hypothetical protein